MKPLAAQQSLMSYYKLLGHKVSDNPNTQRIPILYKLKTARYSRKPHASSANPVFFLINFIYF